MNKCSTMLACGDVNLGPGVEVFIFGVVAYWVVGIVSALINLFFISHFWFHGASNDFKIVNLIVLLAYTGLAITLFCGWPWDGAGDAIFAAFLCPLFPISHLIYFICVSWIGKKNSEKK